MRDKGFLPVGDDAASSRAGRFARNVSLHSAAADGSPQEEDLEGTPRQAPRPARDRVAARQRLPDLPSAEAPAPRVPDVQDVQGPRDRAAPHASAVAAQRGSDMAHARIAIDAMGGDRAPTEIVAGAQLAAADGLTPVLFGPAGLETGGLELVEAPDVIEMHEKPAEAVRSKPDSSLVAACRAVAAGHADAVVSAGNTGAMLAAGLIHLRRVPGVLRPAIAVVIPAAKGPSVLLDAGANADARPEHLLQFATMGSIFARELLEVASPEVRLLSIGEEPEKGNQLTLEAHALLAGERRRLRRQRREPRPARGRRRRRRLRRLHGQRRAEAARRDDRDAARRAARRGRVELARQARRPPDPPGRPAPPRAPRSRRLRRRLPARAARPRGGRSRQLVPPGDRECDPAGRPRRRA